MITDVLYICGYAVLVKIICPNDFVPSLYETQVKTACTTKKRYYFQSDCPNNV